MNTGPLIAIVFIGLVLVLAALRAGLGYRQVRRDADEEWPDFKKTRPDLAKGLSDEAFTSAYVRAHGPRGALYGAIMLVAAVVLTPVIMLMLTGFYGVFIADSSGGTGLNGVNLTNEVRRQFQLDGPLVYAFFLFFGLIASWGAIAFIVARRFHRGRPGSLDDEIRSARGDATLPDAPLARPRPKWSPLVQTDGGLKLPENTKQK